MTKKKKGAQPGNANATKHGFYSDQFTEPERDLIQAFVADLTLDQEIWMQRVLNHRLMVHANLKDAEGAGPVTDVLIKLAAALAIGTGRVARLLRDKRILSGVVADSLAEVLNTALDEIARNGGVDLARQGRL